MTALPAPATPPSSATDPIVGRYTLEIVLATRSGLRCEPVAERANRRTYTADIHNFRDYYAVKLYDATFLRDGGRIRYGCNDARLDTGGVCHQFAMWRSTDTSGTIVMSPQDESNGSEIWEILLADRRLLQLGGNGTWVMAGTTIRGTGTGTTWDGDGLPASDYSSCGPGPMSWTFTRR